MPCKSRQQGVSLIAAVFLITSLALLGTLLARVVALSAEETATDLYAAQALYAAESGVDYAVHQILSGHTLPASQQAALDEGPHPAAAAPVRAWFYVYAEAPAHPHMPWTIYSIGRAGLATDEFIGQRRVKVIFVP